MSSQPGAWSCAGTTSIVIVPVKRDAAGSRVLGLPKGHADGDETRRSRGHARGA